MPTEPLFPLEDQLRSYPGSINVDLSHPGRVSPAFDHAPLSGEADVRHYFGASFVETLDENNLPIVFAFANKTVWKVQNGVISADNTFSSGGVIQDICMVDDSAGVRILMAVFGPAGPTATAGNAERNMSTGVWTNNAGATFLTAYFLKTNSDQVGAATGSTATGRATTVERKFAIAPITADPTLATSYSTGQAVDNDPTWQINNIAVFEERFCIGMPQGFYIRDQQEGRFKNMTPYVIPHGVNGKVTKAAEHGIWYATKKELYLFDGRQMLDKTPFRDMEKPRDLPQGRVSAIADSGDRVLAVLECWDDLLDGKQAADAGLRIFKEDGGVITELTSSALDGSMATTANMEDWGNTTTDFLVFAFPRKLAALGIRTLLTSTANTALQNFITPETLNSAGAWTSLGTIVDATILSTAAMSMQVTGFPASSGESIIGYTNIDAYDTAALQAAAPAGYSGTNLFWYRVRSNTANGFNATGAVAGFQEAFVVPGRPGLQNGGLLAASTNYTSLFRAGGVTRVLEGKREGSNIIWQDRYHLNTRGGVFCCGWSQSPFGAGGTGGGNGGPCFLLLGRFRQMFVMEGKTRDATQTDMVRLVQITTTEPAPIVAIYNLQLGDVRKLTKISKIMAGGVFVQENDAIELQIQVDEWKVYNLGAKRGSHAVWDLTEVDPFWRCHLFFVLKDTTQWDPAAPFWRHMVVTHEDSENEYTDLFTQRSFPTGAEVV